MAQTPKEERTSRKIILMLDQRGEVCGTEQLWLASGVRCKSYFLTCVRRARNSDQIIVIKSTGGRGHKTVYRKRNPNQPGLARKK